MVTDQNRSKQDWLLEALDCYEGRLIQYTANMVGDVERARDIVQEAFLKLWEVKRSKVEGYLEQWLYTVCRNRSRDLIKKEKRMFPLKLDAELAIPDGKSSISNIEQQETKGTVFDAIQTLPANQREVINLKFQSELSYKEISKITGLSVSNVGFLIHNGIKSMRLLLEKQDKHGAFEGSVRCQTG
ncbi:MAG: RNA polymerase sigma factor [Candidatus Anammoxibacter sp.]